MNNRNNWQDWNGMAGRPKMRAGDRVRLQHINGTTDIDKLHVPTEVCWGFVKSYLIVPESREACLERDLDTMTHNCNRADAECESLRARVAELELVTINLRRQVDEARAAERELAECVDNLCSDIHAMGVAHCEFVTATHAGIKRGIELGDLPPDYYGRFRTTWAPKK